ncbi:PilZ domain-containing protein [Sphingomonas daechungensis]|uniref:PilZ domain-containing protein n=1 Tax=Sphingomonas daechungensis TaxID=1176646 RepID=UPI003783D169
MELKDVSRELRRHVNLDAIARRADNHRHDIHLTDISRDGCQFRSDVPFETGEVITIRHEVLGDLLAEVRWACAGRVGALFLRRD